MTCRCGVCLGDDVQRAKASQGLPISMTLAERDLIIVESTVSFVRDHAQWIVVTDVVPVTSPDAEQKIKDLEQELTVSKATVDSWNSSICTVVKQFYPDVQPVAPLPPHSVEWFFKNRIGADKALLETRAKRIEELEKQVESLKPKDDGWRPWTNWGEDK